MIITKLALPRRTFLRGMGATIALPFLDAMVPALRAQSKGVPRFAASTLAMAPIWPSGRRADAQFRDEPDPGGIEGPRPHGVTRDWTISRQPIGDVGVTPARRAGRGAARMRNPPKAPTSRPARPSTRSSPPRFAATRSFRHWKRRSIASTSSAPATTATPART